MLVGQIFHTLQACVVGNHFACPCKKHAATVRLTSMPTCHLPCKNQWRRTCDAEASRLVCAAPQHQKQLKGNNYYDCVSQRTLTDQVSIFNFYIFLVFGMTYLGTCFPFVFLHNVELHFHSCASTASDTQKSQGLGDWQPERRHNLNTSSVLLLHANVYMVPGRRLQRPLSNTHKSKPHKAQIRKKKKKKEI